MGANLQVLRGACTRRLRGACTRRRPSDTPGLTGLRLVALKLAQAGSLSRAQGQLAARPVTASGTVVGRWQARGGALRVGPGSVGRWT